MLISLTLVPLGALAQNAPRDLPSLTTRDAHQDLYIVADPYLTAERYTKETFGKKSPYDAGILAIQVYFRNDNKVPIRLNPGTIRLVVSQPDQERQRLAPLSVQEVADRTVLTANADPKARRPFPFPSAASTPTHNKAWSEMVTTLQTVALSTDVLPPLATTHGFLFFDLNHEFDAIRNTHLYIPDLAFMTDNKALFFFEIDLGLALTK